MSLAICAMMLNVGPSSAATELRLMTWNALTQDSGGGVATAEHIWETGADVVALQEVCEGMLGTIQSELGDGWQVFYHHASINLKCAREPEVNTSFGNAILVRPGVAVRDPIKVDYPACDPQNDESRSFVAVSVILNGVPVRVLSTHLGRFGDGTACQIPLLAQYANSWQRGIIAGDFNIRSVKNIPGCTRPDQAGCRPDEFDPLIAAQMVNAHPWNYFTVENNREDWNVEPTIKIDHIFHKGIQRTARDTPSWNDSSDHRALWMDFTTS
ncbi:endonuclease/exonuclease/phosphatase family protein [Actinomadura chokoriensis]|uniref:Endonuclease/exonuclease/phosphatase family protein n=1 Tax=Actinomadura chokoriensis TaxID=454156 RepID=A0ABV4R478_9ACTN